MYHLKKVMWERNLVFSAKIIHCDFELALVQAISFSFQEIKIFGCYFHYCQSIYRQVNALGLTTLYKIDREIYRWIRLAMSLPLAPVNQVENLWMQLLENKPEGYFFDILKKIEEFADYMTNN
jgi:hypothetical protein